MENAYTRLMAWALNPATDPPTAVLRQKAWLRKLALNGICETETCLTDHSVCSRTTEFPISCFNLFVMQSLSWRRKRVARNMRAYFRCTPDICLHSSGA